MKSQDGHVNCVSRVWPICVSAWYRYFWIEAVKDWYYRMCWYLSTTTICMSVISISDKFGTEIYLIQVICQVKIFTGSQMWGSAACLCFSFIIMTWISLMFWTVHLSIELLVQSMLFTTNSQCIDCIEVNWGLLLCCLCLWQKSRTHHKLQFFHLFSVICLPPFPVLLVFKSNRDWCTFFSAWV